MQNKSRAVLFLCVLFCLAGIVARHISIAYSTQSGVQSVKRVESALSDSTRWEAYHLQTKSTTKLSRFTGFKKIPFVDLGRGEVLLNERYESRFIDVGLEIQFPFAGVPIDVKTHNQKLEFAFRRIFDGTLYRLTYSNSGQLLRQQRVDFKGIDYPIFRVATHGLNNLYWIVYDNRKGKNYLLNMDLIHEKDSAKIELPSFYPPAGGTYEMEPPIFIEEVNAGEFSLVAGALYAEIKQGAIVGYQLKKCETSIETVFSNKGPVVLCRALEGVKTPYFLYHVKEDRIEYLNMAEGIPWKLQFSQVTNSLSINRAKTTTQMLDMFLWDLGRSQQGGVLEFGVNNIEGRIPWSQVYYLNGLMDALLLENLHRDGRAIFSQIADALVDRITLEILSLDDLLDKDKGFHTKGFTHDRSLALFAVQSSRLLLLFDRYSKQFPAAPSLRNTEKFRALVQNLEGHIEQLVHKGESVYPMMKGVSHLHWPKCSAFYFDGMAVPFNHQNEWAYSLFNAAELRGVPKNSPSLNNQRDIINFFMDKMGNKDGFPPVDKWNYWYGQAYEGWKTEDNLSCNKQSYVGDRGLAWISFRTIDFMSVMSALDFVPELKREQLLNSGSDAIKHGDVFPFAAKSLLTHGTYPKIKISVLERYYRATSAWELANTPWALSLSYSSKEH